MFSIAPAAADYQAGADAYQQHDFATAFAEFSAAAQAGDPQAQNALGAMYNHGLGVDLDNSQAAYWYQKAADQNFPLAMRNLATMYTNGHGVPYDLTQAKIWFAKAAELGDNESARRLAALQPLGTAGPDAAPAASFPVATAPANPVPAPAPAPVAAPVAAPQNAAGTAPATPAAAPAPAPAVVQPVAMTPAPTDSGNWLLGQWQGPSLGCPPGGGIEFAPSQALTYFNGQVAVTLSANYRVSGDTVSVTTTGADGVGQNYVYQRSSNDQMTIVGIPDTMPKSLLGAVHKRCGAAPAAAATQQAATPVVQPMTPNPTPEAQPLVSPLANLPPEGTTPAAPAAAAPAAEAPAIAAAAPAAAPATVPAATTPVPANATTKDGWDAFERGDYQGALGIWKSLAATDKNVSVLVGTIYDFGQGVPQDDAEALKWYLEAANAGNGNGQYRAASIYARSQQVPPDYVQAYKWLTLAMQSLPQKVSAKHDELTSIQAELLRSEVSGLMSTSDIGQADALAKSFKPTP